MARNVPKTKTESKSWPCELNVKWRPAGGTSFTPEVHRWKLNGTNQVTYGPNYPDWKRRLQLGQSATTTLDGSRVFMKMQQPLLFQVVGNPATFMKDFARVGNGWSPVYTVPGAPPSTVDSIAEQLAASRLLKNYIAMNRQWHGGATIAEFAETVRFLGSPIKSLYQYTYEFVGRVGKLRKVYRRNPLEYGKLLGGLWLGYAFGIAPMVSDVSDAYNAVHYLANKLGNFDKVRIVGSGENITVLEDSPSVGISYTSYAVQSVLKTQKNQVRYLGEVLCKPPSPGLIADNFGVGFTDILPAVWEGVPWSWLVDYFVNVNEILESVKWAFADVTWMNRTVRNSRIHRYGSARLAISSLDAPYLSGFARGGQGFTQRTRVIRTPSGIPYPGWKFRIPGLPNQYANVSALVLAIGRSKPAK